MSTAPLVLLLGNQVRRHLQSGAALHHYQTTAPALISVHILNLCYLGWKDSGCI